MKITPGISLNPLPRLCFLFLLLLLGCSGPIKNRSDGPPTPESENSRENSDYREIEILFSKDLLDSAQTKITAFSQHHPRSTLLPSVENLHGLLLLRTKKPAPAIRHFKKAADLSSTNPVFRQYILFNLATAQLEAKQLENAQETVNQINTDSLDKENRIKVHFLKATLYEKKSLFLESSRQLLMAGYLFAEVDARDMKTGFSKRLEHVLASISDIPALNSLYQEFEESALADVLLFRLGTLESGGNSEIHLQTLVTRFPQSAYYLQATEMLKQNRNNTNVDGRSVGILLPMKGKFAKFGIKNLQGIQLAFGIFNSNEPDSRINLVVEDSGEDAEQAIAGLNRLVLKHHVVAVIGPILSKGIEKVTQRAQELEIPLLSLARRSGPVQDYVFQAGLTSQLQAYEIARYAIEHLAAKKFAIVYPNDKVGMETSQAFWDAVESMGGKIVGFESYTPEETDFRQTVDKLSGLYYTEARRRELDLLAQERIANNIKKRTRKTEQFFHLRPIVDYDAVFIPDDPKVTGQILPTFAYRDVEHLRFLGTSAWNSPDLLARAQTYAEHASFVDAFYAESTSPVVKRFSEKYKSTFGQTPSAMEALAYDAGVLLRNVLSSSNRLLSRPDIRDRLKVTHEFQGVTGKLTYKDGQFIRDLAVIRVKNGRFVESARN